MVGARPASPVFLDMDLDLAGAYGGLQRGVVALGLIGVGDREIPHRLVERRRWCRDSR